MDTSVGVDDVPEEDVVVEGAGGEVRDLGVVEEVGWAEGYGWGGGDIGVGGVEGGAGGFDAGVGHIERGAEGVAVRSLIWAVLYVTGDGVAGKETCMYMYN